MSGESRTLEDDYLTRFLRDHAVDAEIIRAGADTSTVQAAAMALGVRPDQIVKSLLFQGKDGTAILVVVRGLAKVDQRKLAAASWRSHD